MDNSCLSNIYGAATRGMKALGERGVWYIFLSIPVLVKMSCILHDAE